MYTTLSVSVKAVQKLLRTVTQDLTELLTAMLLWTTGKV